MITFALDEAENAQMTGLSRVKPIWTLWDSRVFRQIKITFRDLETVEFLEIQLFKQWGSWFRRSLFIKGLCLRKTGSVDEGIPEERERERDGVITGSVS